MADPGFSVGGRGPHGGCELPRWLRFENFYVKTKESGPLGGGVRRASANVSYGFDKHSMNINNINNW